LFSGWKRHILSFYRRLKNKGFRHRLLEPKGINYLPEHSADYRIEVGSKARKYIEKLDKPNRKRFAEQLEDIKKDPAGNSKPIVNSDPPLRSSRVGGWRIVLSVDDVGKVVVITTVMPRGQVYDRV
jgi:mRNA interferase RelE/StbE